MKNIILRWAHGFKKEIPEQINSINNNFHTRENTFWEMLGWKERHT